MQKENGYSKENRYVAKKLKKKKNTLAFKIGKLVCIYF